MDSVEKYLFDLQGYVTVPNALSANQLAALNAILEEHIEAECEPDMQTHRFSENLSWGKTYTDLLDNPRVSPYLDGTFGPGKWRLDHVYLDVIRAGKGPIGTRLHGGGTANRSSMYYRFEDGEMSNGLSVVAYNLADVGPMDGGFGCVPGSHKSNYAFPDDWREMEELNPIVQRVTGPAGTAVVFTEALTHGTLPWTASHERRTLFLKFSPHAISWSASYYDADDFEGLTERQRAILMRPNGRYQEIYDPKAGRYL